MSETVDQSGTYPIKHSKPAATPHKDPEGNAIKITEELSETVKLGISNGRYCLIVHDEVHFI